MTTREDFYREPERLGMNADLDDVELFLMAVDELIAQGQTEPDAIEQVWNGGDWLPVAEAIANA